MSEQPVRRRVEDAPTLPCPACDGALQLLDSGDVVVDACIGGCGGVWFDNFELKRVDERHETAGEGFLEIDVDPAVKVDSKRRRQCPVCETIVLRRHFFSVKKKIEVDECSQCGGIWLDAGELGALRAEFATEVQRVESAQAHFGATFDKELAEMRAQSEDAVRRAEKYAVVSRMLGRRSFFAK